MFRSMVALLGAVVMAGAATPAMAGDCKGCDKFAKTGEGFCNEHGKGKIFGVDLTSEKLYTTLAGQEIDAAELKCPGCKAAAKTNGRCDHCNVGIAEGKAFHSTVSYKLAKGTPMTAEKAAHCEACRTAFESNGRCTACNVGFVAGRAYEDESDYKAALAAHKTLALAVKTARQCEGCAVAMVTDGKCAHCKTRFKDGEKIEG